MKSAKNKTIDISLTDGKEYLERCIYINRKMEEKQILNKTIIGDSLKVMEKLPRSFVDLLIVDPPYNLSKNYHGNKFNKTNNNEYEQYTVAWIDKALPLLKPNASIYVCCDWKSSLVIGPVLQRYFQIQNRITWQREKGRGASHNWKNGMEDIWFATMNDNYIFNLEDVKIRRKVLAPYKENGKPKDWEQTEDGRFRNTCPSNFWDDISIPYWSMPENTAHPTQKPEKLIAKLILASSNKGDVVFDPFLGSGTTSVTAKKLGRQYVGIEQNPNYCIWAEKRLELAETTSQIQGYSDGIFWERNVQINKKAPK
ncbi:MAG: site-specific DNA-methyltransferase [Alphaproteobacteria bacterium]|nr:site-specific DNA-methyltransferase [Alphaproteobacteria bacterium]